MTRRCGCRDIVPFPAKCAHARALEAQLCQAFREKDWETAHSLGARLAGPHENLPAGDGARSGTPKGATP